MSDVPPEFAGLKMEHQQGNLIISWPTLGQAWAIVFAPLALVFAFPPLLWIFSSDPILITSEIACTITPITLFSLVLFYLTLVSLFNRSVIQISQSELRAETGPLPYESNKTLNSTNIQRIYVRSKRTRRTTVYALYALTRNNRREKLVTVRNGQLALYLKEEIERFLGIKDQVVRGEWRPEPYLLK